MRTKYRIFADCFAFAPAIRATSLATLKSDAEKYTNDRDHGK